jgi:predicted RNA-binding Zn ribbon-like protein
MPNRPTAAGPAIGRAPGSLATLQAFVNTLDIEQSADELTSPQALGSWLSEAGLTAADDKPRMADLQQALELREALRGVLRSHALHAPANPGHTAEPGHAADLSRIAASLPTRLEAGPDGEVRHAPAGSGPQAALTRILLIAAEAVTLGTWTRLKACSADDCQWAFYDRSPTRNGCWCSMQICGSRAKSRSYRRRASAGGRAPASRPTGREVTASRSGRTAAPGA